MAAKRKNGFSIIQAMVGATFLSFLALAFNQMMTGALRGQKNVQNAVDFDLLKSSLNLVFNTKACNGSLFVGAGSPLVFSFPPGLAPGDNLVPASSPILLEEIKHGNSPIATRGAPMTGGMTLTKLEISDAIYDGPQTVMDTSTLPATTVLYKAFSTLIYVEATKATGSIGAQKLTARLSARVLAKASAPNIGKVDRCATVSGGKTLLDTFQVSEGAVSGSAILVVGVPKLITIPVGDAIQLRGSIKTSHFAAGLTLDWDSQFSFLPETGEFSYSMSGFHWARSGTFIITNAWKAYGADYGAAGYDGDTTSLYPALSAPFGPYRIVEVKHDTISKILEMKISVYWYPPQSYSVIVDRYGAPQ